MKMESIEKDRLRELFSGMPDEPLPLNFNEKVMSGVRREALRREKRRKQQEVFGYVAGTVAMAGICVLMFHFMGIPLELPELKLPCVRPFFQPDFSMFRSQSFILSVFTGMSALFLLIIDSIIRHHTGKKHK
jgi:hypothetical protein